MKTEENAEFLKKFVQVWPNITVRKGEKITNDNGSKETIRTATTLLRLKKDGEYKLIQVRFDYCTTEYGKKLELSWIECMNRFLAEVQFAMNTWDGVTGIRANDQND